jgi:hypothetical protein
MCVVEQPVAEGIRDGRVADLVMPLLHRHLAGEDRRSIAIAVLHDFEQIPALAVGEGHEPLVIEHDDVEAPPWPGEAEKKFRRVQGWRDIEKLVKAFTVIETKEEAAAERVA